MANASFKVNRISFEVNRISFILTDPEKTIVEVECGPTSDGTLGVEGVHRKAYPAIIRDRMDEIWKEIGTLAYLVGEGWEYTPAPHITARLDLSMEFVEGRITFEDFVRRLDEIRG